jgi:peptidoglycan/LPS O-acetylase OafA/YrhL
METSPPTKTRRIVELDALRALAAINLMLFHFTHVYSVKFGYTTELGFEWPYGKYGVELFFVLSGFVNAMTLLKKRDAKRFVINRLLRILPIFYVVYAVNLVLMFLPPLSTWGDHDLPTLLANLTLMPNLLGYECLEPVTWTLQIEMLFYVILTGVFLAGGFERPIRTWLLYLVLCFVGCTLVHPVGEIGQRATPAQWMRELLLLEYVPLFVMGMMIQQIRFGSETGWNRWGKNGLVIAIAFAVFHITDDRDFNPAATLLILGIMFLAAFGRLPVLRMKPLVFISTISYSLYLLHNNLGCVVIYHMDHYLGVPPIVCFALMLGLTVVFAWTSTKFLEQPLSNWLRRRVDAYTAARSPNVATTPTPEVNA